MTGLALLLEYKRTTQQTQTQLAARFGVTPGYVSLLLSGDRIPGRLALVIERATGGAVPAHAWAHDLSKRATVSKRKPIKRVLTKRAATNGRGT